MSDSEGDTESQEDVEEEQAKRPIQYLNQSTQIISALVFFLAALGTLFFRVFQLVAVFISWFFFIVSISPYLFLVGVITVGAIPYVKYQSIIIQEIDFFARCRLEPLYVNGPRELIVFIQLLYDALICWYNMFAWLPYGIVRYVITPLFIDCGFTRIFLNLFNFFFIFFVDFVVNYVLFVRFLQNDFDYVPTVVAWQAFWTSWQQGIYCTCSDLESFLASAWVVTVVPPVIPIPAQIFVGFPYSIVSSTMPFYNLFLGPMIGLVASDQLGDFRFWAGLWSAFNGCMNIFQQVWRIVLAILTGQFNSNFPRPNFDKATRNFCQAVTYFMRSVESINQAFFDNFLPFLNLQWTGLLSMYDSALCVVFRLVNIVLQVIFNLDRVIQYPGNPYYDVVIVPQVIEAINLLAPTRYQSPVNGTQIYPIQYVSWNWPTTSPLIPGTLLPNPVYNVSRVSDNVCYYLNRIICDPSNDGPNCTSTILGKKKLVRHVARCAEILTILFLQTHTG